jgi:RNA polymerase sigma-70 factor (ECF subfamily)
MATSPQPPPNQEEHHRDQFIALYRAYFRFTRHLVREAGVEDADVADVVQEVFALLDRALRSGLDTKTSLYGWLRRAAYRKARDFRALARNREQPAPRYRAGERVATKDPTPEESMLKVDICENVHAVLDQLPNDQRLVLVMSDISNMPMHEIADVLEIQPNIGYSLLYKARQLFKQHWDARRESGLPAIAPFMLWDAPSVLQSMQTTISEPPPHFEHDVLKRLVDSFGWAGTGAAAAAGGALGAGAVKAGLMLTTKQVATGVLVSAITGAGIYAATRTAVDELKPKTEAVIAREDGRVQAAAPVPVESVAPIESAPSVTPTAVTKASATKPAPAKSEQEASDRIMLDIAHNKLSRGDLDGAREALKLVKSARFKVERDELFRTVREYQDGGR